MPGWAWTTLKWVLALSGMLLVVVIAVPMAVNELSQAISFDDGDDADGVIQPSPEPDEDDLETTGGEARSVAMAGVRDGVVHTTDTATLTLSPAGAAEVLVAFDALPADPACLLRVELEMQLVESGETEVHIRPARVADLRALAQGEPLPADAAVDGGAPGRAFTSGAPGRLRWHATTAYSIAAREAEADADVVLSVYLPNGADVETTFATGLEQEEHTASLIWTAVEGCQELDDFDPDDFDPGDFEVDDADDADDADAADEAGDGGEAEQDA